MRTILIIIVLAMGKIFSQDTLSIEHLKDISYSFKIEKGKMSGAGADSLASWISKSQFTMIGEYHGSMRISTFTSALIPICDANAYKTMALEVGPISAEVLTEISSPAENTLEALSSFNKRYHYDNGDFTAIPFFENKEDGVFLQEARSREWNLIGLDQEFSYSFEMLVDRMYNQLPVVLQRSYKDQYAEILREIKSMIKADDEGSERFSVAALKSENLIEYLDKMYEVEENEKVVNAFWKSVEIYHLHAKRQWYENNETRIKYMKENMRKGMNMLDFDIKKDKMLLKMGGYHLSKGRSPLGFYEIGNMMNEIAAFNGNQALNISFSERFYMEDGEIKDVIEEFPQSPYIVFAALGKKDEWILIDLRKMRKGIYYNPIQYRVGERIEDLISRYDLLIIPPTELPPTRHF